jgi:hypothetical protein
MGGQKENTSTVLLAVCVCCGRCLGMDLHVTLIIGLRHEISAIGRCGQEFIEKRMGFHQITTKTRDIQIFIQ